MEWEEECRQQLALTGHGVLTRTCYAPLKPVKTGSVEGFSASESRLDGSEYIKKAFPIDYRLDRAYSVRIWSISSSHWSKSC